MNRGEMDRPVYQMPVIVPLGALAVGSGTDCEPGASADDCNLGSMARTSCENGNSDRTDCDPAGSSAQTKCDTGTGVF
jgi:hypothetical protein